MNKTKSLVASMLLVSTMISCNNQKKEEGKAQMPEFDAQNMDLSVKPSDNFYLYANGGWKKLHPMPEDKGRFGSFDLLREENDKKVKSLIVDLSKKTDFKKGTNEQKISDFYASGMDTEKIEKLGFQPIKADLEKINNLKSFADLQNFIIEKHKTGDSNLFYFYGGPDSKNSTINIANLYQGGLSLGDREYYLNEDDASAKLRKQYTTHIANMLKLIGVSDIKSKEMSSTVMKIETELAEISMNKLDRRDPFKTYNKKSIADLQKIFTSIDWNTYLKALNVDIKDINITSMPFFEGLDNILKANSVDDWKVYYTWKTVHGSANFLSSAFVEEHFNFYGKIKSGVPKMKPRWKKILAATNGSLGEAVGEVYVAKFFPPKAKQRIDELVNNVKLALGDRINNLEWMSDETKVKAHEKLNAFKVKIGYPDKWKDYSELNINRDSYYQNVLNASIFEFKENLAKIGKPVDKAEWGMTPQTVNAYYHPLHNEIVFPAAILQPPFFYMDADDAVNYGAIGVVIGHEMTHGFDDKGRFYDSTGNLNNWWTEKDSEEFVKRADVLVEQFNNFVVLDDLHANGKYTLGENIADLGGLNISLTAYKKTTEAKNNKEIDGFSPMQRFFLAYARVWAQNIRDKEQVRLTKEDVHSLGRFRVNGPLPHMSEFYSAFNIKEGENMFIKEEDRANIW
ncbi:MAG: M13 family metallopeptidase [Marinifilaceae bacterium]|jgi:putative endopeptidase|nr:M13 family metallopeptidase [Marinifilaceae bacterium]